MNQKLIATSVFKHPLVQPLIELKSLEQSLINQIIIEEVLRERSNDPLDILADFVDEKESLFNRIEDYITHAKNNPEDLKGLHQKLTFGKKEFAVVLGEGAENWPANKEKIAAAVKAKKYDAAAQALVKIMSGSLGKPIQAAWEAVNKTQGQDPEAVKVLITNLFAWYEAYKLSQVVVREYMEGDAASANQDAEDASNAIDLVAEILIDLAETEISAAIAPKVEKAIDVFLGGVGTAGVVGSAETAGLTLIATLAARAAQQVDKQSMIEGALKLVMKPVTAIVQSAIVAAAGEGAGEKLELVLGDKLNLAVVEAIKQAVAQKQPPKAALEKLLKENWPEVVKQIMINAKAGKLGDTVASSMQALLNAEVFGYKVGVAVLEVIIGSDLAAEIEAAEERFVEPQEDEEEPTQVEVELDLDAAEERFGAQLMELTTDEPAYNVLVKFTAALMAEAVLQETNIKQISAIVGKAVGDPQTVAAAINTHFKDQQERVILFRTLGDKAIMQGYIGILKGAQSEDDEVERVLNWDLLPQAAEVIAKAMIAMAEQEGIELTNDNVDEYFEKAFVQEMDEESVGLVNNAPPQDGTTARERLEELTTSKLNELLGLSDGADDDEYDWDNILAQAIPVVAEKVMQKWEDTREGVEGEEFTNDRFNELFEEVLQEVFEPDQLELLKAKPDVLNELRDGVIDALYEMADEAQPDQEPEEDEQQEEVEDIDPKTIQELILAHDKWVGPEGFMEVKFLDDQSKIFAELWSPVKQIAGRAIDPLEKRERSITSGTASKEEEAESAVVQERETPTEPEAPAPEPDAAAPDEEQPEAEPENQEEIPPEEKQEFRRDILEGLIVAQRHTKQVQQVLQIYQKFTEKLTAGSVEAFKKFGEPNPKKLLYKLVKLLVKDINRMLQTIAEVEPPEEPLAESLLEVEGEKFSDKLRKVKAANDVVRAEGQVLIEILKKLQGQATEPSPEGENTAQGEPPADNSDLTGDGLDDMADQIARDNEQDDGTLQEQEEVQSSNLSAKEKAEEIYKAMATVKEYFPTANPLASEHSFKRANKQFEQLVTRFQKHISQMSRFKDDKQINLSALSSAKEELEQIKAILMDLFGVDEEGSVQQAGENEGSYTPETPERIEAGEVEAPSTTDPTPPEAEVEEVPDEVKTISMSGISQMQPFLVKETGLFNADIRMALNRVEPTQQLTLMRFAMYLIAFVFTKPKLNEEEEEEINKSQTLALKALEGVADGEKVKELIQVMKTDEQLTQDLDSLNDLIAGEADASAEKQNVIKFFQAVGERMKSFNLEGSWDTKERLKILRNGVKFPDIEKAIAQAQGATEQAPSNEPRPDSEIAPGVQGQWRPGGQDQYYTSEQLIQNKLKPIIRRELKRKYG